MRASDRSRRQARRRRRWPRWLLGVVAVVGGCTDANPGVSPPEDQLFFPEGLLLDPRTPEGEAARYLFVTNGNNDLNFNSGSLLVLDLERFFGSWTADDGRSVYPYCEKKGDEVDGRCVLDPGFDTDEDHPCRRLALRPNIVECDESAFAVESVRIGDFATVLASSNEGVDAAGIDRHRLWVPVRGGPSITYVDLLRQEPAERDPGEPPECEPTGPTNNIPADPAESWKCFPVLDCGQSEHSGEDDPLRCADDHRLTHLRNDDSDHDNQLEREPFNLLVDDTHRLVYVAHSAGGTLTLIDMDGLVDRNNPDGDGDPVITDVFLNAFAQQGGRSGGFGLAARPCDAEADPPNAPSKTLGCTRPLIYGTWRYQPFLTTFTVNGIDPEDLDATVGNQYCAPTDELGEPGAINCNARIRDPGRITLNVLDPLSTSTRPLLGDLAFADDRGDRLYMLQTNPGALLPLNTALDEDGRPNNIPAGPAIEVCAEPTRMTIFTDDFGGSQRRFALITCFRAAYLYVVDLHTETVVAVVQLATGPHDIVADPVRKIAYAANTLESSISVIDLKADSPTRFTEIARIGLQEPFSR